MAIRVDLQIASDTDKLPDKQTIYGWIKLAIGSHCQEAEISIRIVSKNESQALNLRYRRQDKPTNVLSFPADFPVEANIPFLGDIVVCAAIVEQEALEQQKDAQAHWAHILIHGALHLIGYDHQQDQEALEMETLEVQLLSQLGYGNPYEWAEEK